MTQPPIILLTQRGKPADQTRRHPTPYPYEWSPSAFATVVCRAGGVPVFLSNESRPESIRHLISRCDGLFLTGGEDMAPEYYGESDVVGNLTINASRDVVEMAAISAADEMGMPILGVCRGVQVLNVARGGTLYQDLDQQLAEKPRDHSRGPDGFYVQTHDVEVSTDCRLGNVLARARAQVATSHHQAVKDIGRGLKVVARSSEDGVIEAVEDTSGRFVVGVQWHPEVRAHDEETIRLFDAFVEACRQFAAARVSPI
jgi:putative glutamine amidotransferase